MMSIVRYNWATSRTVLVLKVLFDRESAASGARGRRERRERRGGATNGVGIRRRRRRSECESEQEIDESMEDEVVGVGSIDVEEPAEKVFEILPIGDAVGGDHVLHGGAEIDVRVGGVHGENDAVFEGWEGGAEFGLPYGAGVVRFEEKPVRTSVANHRLGGVHGAGYVGGGGEAGGVGRVREEGVRGLSDEGGGWVGAFQNVIFGGGGAGGGVGGGSEWEGSGLVARGRGPGPGGEGGGGSDMVVVVVFEKRKKLHFFEMRVIVLMVRERY